MTTFLATLLLTLAFVAVALYGFWRLGPPVYQLERRNVETLLEMIVEGRATVSDWEVFAGIPIRHDPELHAIQRQCLEIAETEYTGSARLFTQRGIEQLAALLEEMRREDDEASRHS